MSPMVQHVRVHQDVTTSARARGVVARRVGKRQQTLGMSDLVDTSDGA